jgi:Uma2 family endonuclease
MFVKGTARVVKSDVRKTASICVDGSVTIPYGLADLESFRNWTRSDSYPERGDFCWLGGLFWVDLSMEELYTHNQVKTEYTSVLQWLGKQKKKGYVCADRMRVSHPVADLSCEPDLMFVSFASLDAGLIREIESEAGTIEFEGTPDMVLEILSKSSDAKDLKWLPELYFAAGVKEYWLVDARGDKCEFEIFKRGHNCFIPSPRRKGLLRSKVFNASFKLERSTDARGKPVFTLTLS